MAAISRGKYSDLSIKLLWSQATDGIARGTCPEESAALMLGFAGSTSYCTSGFRSSAQQEHGGSGGPIYALHNGQVSSPKPWQERKCARRLRKDGVSPCCRSGERGRAGEGPGWKRRRVPHVNVHLPRAKRRQDFMHASGEPPQVSNGSWSPFLASHYAFLHQLA